MYEGVRLKIHWMADGGWTAHTTPHLLLQMYWISIQRKTVEAQEELRDARALVANQERMLEEIS